MSPELLLFLAFALFGAALHMRWESHEADRRDARRRNPRTWDDRP
jgi:hypothetical protein